MPTEDRTEISPELQSALNRMWAATLPSYDEYERAQMWSCEDGWIVGYTTTRIIGGPRDGQFAAFAYKPIGPGARTGKATRFQKTYLRGFAKRKTARARAEVLFYQHSPKLAAKHGRTK